MRGFASSILIGAAFVGTLVGVSPIGLPFFSSPEAAPARIAGSTSDEIVSEPVAVEYVSGCRAVDGDTLRCGSERVRLLAIDAPEMPGHCQPGRDCAPGDPFASTASLQRLMEPRLRIERVGTDRYGRTLAVLKGSQGDLSCYQLRHGQAIYKQKWDNGLLVARACPDAV